MGRRLGARAIAAGSFNGSLTNAIADRPRKPCHPAELDARNLIDAQWIEDQRVR
jgi:hypothetical protein